MAEEEEAQPEIPEIIPKEIKMKIKKKWDFFMSYFNEFSKGIFKLNPTFVMVLGLCPTLAVTTSLDNAIGMGFAASFVLLLSAIFISSIRKATPSNVRIPIFIVVIATFVTIASLLLKAFSPSLDKSLGIYVPLIVVNCIIFGRAESFSSKNTVFRSILDALGVAIGFFLALVLISSIRELLGTGKLVLFGSTILNWSNMYNPMLIFILSPGALLTMGLLLAFFNSLGYIHLGKKKGTAKDNTQKAGENQAAEEKKAQPEGA